MENAAAAGAAPVRMRPGVVWVIAPTRTGTWQSAARRPPSPNRRARLPHFRPRKLTAF